MVLRAVQREHAQELDQQRAVHALHAALERRLAPNASMWSCDAEYLAAGSFQRYHLRTHLEGAATLENVPGSERLFMVSMLLTASALGLINRNVTKKTRYVQVRKARTFSKIELLKLRKTEPWTTPFF